MKPSFALDFRDGVIALLHRTSRGWQQVGTTPIDAPDLAEALSYLRATALGLSPRGLATKLVIPNDQILYTQVHAPGPELAKRRKQIKAGLEGLTPYAVDDLIYDWWGDGSEIHVAVVAKETLAEAEAFAATHRFNPVSFVAAPDSGAFRGEPYFGTSAMAASLLAEGEKVERDQDPITLVPRDYPKPPAQPTPEEAAKLDELSAMAAQETVVPTPGAQTLAEAEVEPEAEPDALAAIDAAEPLPLADGPADADPAGDAPAPDATPDAQPSPAESLSASTEDLTEGPGAKPAEVDPLPDFTTARAPAAGVQSFDPKAMAIDLVDEAPMALDVQDDPTEPQPIEKGADWAAKDAPPVAATDGFAAFASRRSTDEARIEPKMTPTADFAAAAAEAKARKMPTVGPAPSQRPAVPRPSLAKPASPLPSASRDTVLFPGRSQGGKPGVSKGKAAVTAPGIAGPRRERNVVPLPKAASAQTTEGFSGGKSPATALTGLDGRPLQMRGKPRYLGLVLTGLLLVALALVAAWSSFYLSSIDGDPNAAPTTDGVASLPADPAASDLPSAEDEALADGQNPDLAAETVTTGEADVVAIAAAEPEPAPVPEPGPGAAVASDAATASVPSNDPQDEIFLAAADTPPKTSDPVLLPQPTAGSDPPPQEAAPPPPFGTVYTFDADGRIRPTPEGIMTPEGVLLIAGAPNVVPPTRPVVATGETAAATPDGAVAAAVTPQAPAVTPAETFAADPALAGKKPKSRPAGLVKPDALSDQQGESLAPAADSRFANARPQRRHVALTETTGAAEAPLNGNEAAAASLAANGVQASTSALAVSVSRKPAARPSGRDQAVDAAVAAAVQAPEPQNDTQTQTASLAPEAQSEPEVEAPAPKMPTNASVAKQATSKDVLNLNKVALIGIFGSASGRYALVRQPGGGIKKVVVGDTIDGGRIAAISATALQYQKGGRMVTLTLPQG